MVMNKEIVKLDLQSELYPSLLKNIQNPPEILYCMGNIELLETDCVAVVGARKNTEYGKNVTERIVGDIAKNGLTIVSGLARGIDSISHRRALEVGGRTIAVLGTGIDKCYPASNRKLREDILKENLIISEYPEGMMGGKYTFPMRNRIISGLSKAVIVVEAGVQSGSLITAECGSEQGRTVFAVPGNITNINSMGTNKLLQDGAVPLINSLDILEYLGVKNKTKENNKINNKERLGKDEEKFIQIIRRTGETTVDYLCKETKYKLSEVKSIITIMEIKGLITTASGKIFIANF